MGGIAGRLDTNDIHIKTAETPKQNKIINNVKYDFWIIILYYSNKSQLARNYTNWIPCHQKNSFPMFYIALRITWVFLLLKNAFPTIYRH